MHIRPQPRSTSLDARGYPRYWDEERETMPRVQREALILERLQSQLHRVYETIPFYRRHYDQHGFRPDMVRSLEDFTEKVPPITKKLLVADQAAHPPFGSYVGELSDTDTMRIHGSSGTSGTPTLYRVSKQDWEHGANMQAMSQWCAGVRPDDLMHISYPFGLFFGSWGLLQGAETIGATLFPVGVTDSEKQLEFINRLNPTVFCATPSYCMHLSMVAEQMGMDLKSTSIKTLLIGGEPGGSLPGTRDAIEEAWGAHAVDFGSTSEMYPFHSSVTCAEGTGQHQFIDENYTEVVDKEDLHSLLPEGDQGAVVYTHLWRTHQPMIRFAPGDETFMTYEDCPCGRTYPRLPEGVLGRLDDMLVVRGANLYPATIEMGLRSVEGLGPEFRITLSKVGALDEIDVEVERSDDSRRSEAELRAEAESALKRLAMIRVGVKVVASGTLPPTTFKARRVVDLRRN